MTDMRATERLLEVIWELTQPAFNAANEGDIEACRKVINEIGDAAWELRKRGDTLVRAADLREVIEGQTGIGGDPEVYDAAVGRIENALGGKMR